MPKPNQLLDMNRNDPFAAFFQEAEGNSNYHIEKVKLEFTEKVVQRMQALSVNRSELARRMGVKPAFITRILAGGNNFEISTMVKMSMALDCEFRCHLQNNGEETMWINILKEDPRPKERSVSWGLKDYLKVEHQQNITDESVLSAA